MVASAPISCASTLEARGMEELSMRFALKELISPAVVLFKIERLCLVRSNYKGSNKDLQATRFARA